MVLRQDKDFIQKYKRALAGQSNPASLPHGFEEGSFTECRHSPWYRLQFLIHYGPAVIGVEASPSMAAFPTSNFISTPLFSAPLIEVSGQGSFRVLQTSSPQLDVSLHGTSDISSRSDVSQCRLTSSCGLDV